MLKNMKIGKRLIVTFIIVAIIASASGILSIFTTTNINTNYSKALVNYGFAQGDIGKSMLMIADNRRAVRDIVSCTNQKYIDEAKADLVKTNENYANYAKAVEPTLTSDTTRALYATAVSAANKYVLKRDEVVKLGDTTDPQKSADAREVMMEELDPLYEDVYNTWAEIMAYKVNYGQDQSHSLSDQTNMTMVINISLVCTALFVSVLLGVFISRGISGPIKDCAARLVLLSQGDITTGVPEPTSTDETATMLNALRTTTDFLREIIGDIGNGLGEMSKGNLRVVPKVEFKGDFKELENYLSTIVFSLNDTLYQINQASDQVSSGSDQVSSGAQALSQGATEQASSVEELAATINEISQQVKNNADNAMSASKMANKAGSEVVDSNKKMQELINAMSDISSSSQEIGKVIKTIEDIAFQTNILALNAAVEAARAGAAGKGFAVVADEVRNLASKSSIAAKGTTELIEGAVMAVENGTKLADETAKSLGSVVVGTQKVAALINRISTASNEQAGSISQVTQGIEQISAVVQTNSATAEESAAASEELSGQSAMLKELVSKFKLRETSNIVSEKHFPTHKPNSNAYINEKY